MSELHIVGYGVTVTGYDANVIVVHIVERNQTCALMESEYKSICATCKADPEQALTSVLACALKHGEGELKGTTAIDELLDKPVAEREKYYAFTGHLPEAVFDTLVAQAVMDSMEGVTLH